MKTYILVEVEHSKALPADDMSATDLIAQRLYGWLLNKNVQANVVAKLLDEAMREQQ